ncbi:MAG: hypothetical protein H7Y17_03545 [Chlorobia bacterium]|nr:hypothetical protein [Fimbriimonadaceae bacterium]
MRVPPELRRWMWLVWTGGLAMIFLALWMAWSLSMQKHTARVERMARGFYASEASGQDPSRAFSKSDRDRYRLEILDKFGRAQRVLKMECMTSPLGIPNFCYVNVQRSRSETYEIIHMRRKSWVMVYQDTHSPLR